MRTTMFASADLGSVGFSSPTVNLWFRIAPEGTGLYSDAFREAAASEEGWKATVTAVRFIALTAYDLLSNSKRIRQIQGKFRELKEKEGK